MLNLSNNSQFSFSPLIPTKATDLLWSTYANLVTVPPPHRADWKYATMSSTDMYCVRPVTVM